MTAPRLWQVSVHTNEDGEEAAASHLEKLSGQSAAVYRSEKTQRIIVTVYLEKLPLPQRALRAALKTALHHGRITLKRLRRENWAESWKRHFPVIEIGRRLLIKPSWSRRRAKPGQSVVVLDPGLSFGTGQHPTTLFCLQQLVQGRRLGYVQSMLDIGCGSGILAIAAAKLGYKPVLAFDNDPEAVRVARRNSQRNRVRLQIRCAELSKLKVSAKRRYDMVCANLVCDLLMELAEKIRDLVKPGGKLVVAGILRGEFSALAEKLRICRLTLEKRGVSKEWKSGRFALLRDCSPAGN